MESDLHLRIAYGDLIGGASGDLVSHSRTPDLFDGNGAPVALVPVDDPGTPDVDEGEPAKVTAFLEKWVK